MVRKSFLRRLESESIHIFREVVAGFDNPVLLYSIGKDSSVLLHLARKAYYPSPIPFPLLHIDTGWKFKEMISFRNTIAKQLNLKMLIYQNPDGLKRKINPFDHGAYYTSIMKTEALKQALNLYQFDAAIGGARRDEEKSRAKERIFSFRNQNHVWDSANQRPEVWQTFNTRLNKGQTVRVFPLSNWTESDVWHYIIQEDIAVVPLYFAKSRPVVERDGTLIMLDDDRLTLKPWETVQNRNIRFRTLGCYPLTGAMLSNADSLEEIIDENSSHNLSERNGRIIDKDQMASMEQKKVEGYF